MHSTEERSPNPDQQSSDNDCPTKKRSNASLKFGIDRILGSTEMKNVTTESRATKDVTHDMNKMIHRKRKRNAYRCVFSRTQRELLENWFERTEYVSKGERYHISVEVGINEEQVKIWFQNRRTKKKKLERNNYCENHKQYKKTYAGRVFYNVE